MDLDSHLVSCQGQSRWTSTVIQLWLRRKDRVASATKHYKYEFCVFGGLMTRGLIIEGSVLFDRLLCRESTDCICRKRVRVQVGVSRATPELGQIIAAKRASNDTVR